MGCDRVAIAEFSRVFLRHGKSIDNAKDVALATIEFLLPISSGGTNVT